MDTKKYKLFDQFTHRVKVLLPENRWLRYLYCFLLLISFFSVCLIDKMPTLIKVYDEKPYLLLLPLVSGLAQFFLFIRSCMKLWSYENRKNIRLNLLVRSLVLIVCKLITGIILLIISILLLALGGMLLGIISMFSVVDFTWLGIVCVSLMGLCFLLGLQIILQLFVPIHLFYHRSFIAKIKLVFQMVNLHKFKLSLIIIFYNVFLLFSFVMMLCFIFPMLLMISIAPAFIVTIYVNLYKELMYKRRQQIRRNLKIVTH